MTLDYKAKQFTLFQLLEAASEGELKVDIGIELTPHLPIKEHHTCSLVERLHRMWHLHFEEKTFILDEDCDDVVVQNTGSDGPVWIDVKGEDDGTGYSFRAKLSFYRIVTQHIG